MITALAFIAAIIIIVAVHEYGHYLAMRLFGVRVLTFSIGFGPRLYSWRGKSGTEFTLAAIPLGGYVKPLDRRDTELAPGEEHEDFSGKPAWQRVITYAAGPFFNLLLATALIWSLLIGGEQVRAPVIGAPQVDSAAAAAGLQADDEITAVGARQVDSWNAVITALLEHVGDREPVALEVQRDGRTVPLSLSLAAWEQAPDKHPLEVLGFGPRPMPAVVDEVTPDSAAAAAGLQAGDRIIAVDGEQIAGWDQWVQVIQTNPGTPLEHRVLREGSERVLTLSPQSVEREGQQVGQAGVRVRVDVAEFREIHYGPLAAVGEAVTRVVDQSWLMVQTFGKLVTLKLSLKATGGLPTIAEAAGSSAAMGLAAFISFLVFLNIMLGTVNLLPVPMLDGGWIVFGVIEMIIRRPLPERFLMQAQVVGFVVVISLVLVTNIYDVVRRLA